MSRNFATPLAATATTATAPFSAENLDPATGAFVDGLAGSPPIYTLTPEDARAVLSGAQKSVMVTLPEVSSNDEVLMVGPEGRTGIRVVRPAGATATLPVIVYIHGGGWVIGDKETHDRLIRELAVGANAVVVFVDYDRSPESRYPTAIEQSYAVTKYVAEHPAEFGADAGRLAIAGDSVGGNMAAVVALMAKERKVRASSPSCCSIPSRTRRCRRLPTRSSPRVRGSRRRGWLGSGTNIYRTLRNGATFTPRR